MATFNIEYGKIRQDGSRIAYIRLCINSTSKRMPVPYVLEKNEYKVYPDGRVKVTNNEKYFAIQDMFNEYHAKLLTYLRDQPFSNIDAENLFMLLARKEHNEIQEMDFLKWAKEWLAFNKPKDINNYKTALNTIVKFTGKQTLMFCELDYMFLKRLCAFLKDRPRACSQYLSLIRHLYKEACAEFNTDREFALSPNLFERFKVPKQKPAGQRALEVDVLRKFFAYEPKGQREILAKDACMLSFCLMGTNSVDLFAITDYRPGVICYDRTKTKDRRPDNAHIEIDVHPLILPLIEKYRSNKGLRLFNFSENYYCANQFNKSINQGLKQISEAIGLPKIQFYQFRHSWASIARNELNIDAYTVDKALNHINSDFTMLDLYVKRNYKAINEANKRVIEYVFGK